MDDQAATCVMQSMASCCDQWTLTTGHSAVATWIGSADTQPMSSRPTETSWQLRFDRLAVADVMTVDPVMVGVDATVEAAEQMLAAYLISGLPVVDGAGQLVGVLSRTDLLLEGGPVLTQLVRGRASGLRVGELMSSPPVTVSLSATLVEAARIMRDERVHRLVVVNEHDEPIGVLSATDYVTLIADG
jgi:CBS domain-containing protein